MVKIMEGLEKQKLLHVCYCFGGSTYFGSEYWGRDPQQNYCYMGTSDLKTVTDSNTCEELKGDLNPERTQCRIPIENVTQLRKRKHPKYYDEPLDQLAYELLVEEAQSNVIHKEEKSKRDPTAEQRELDIFKKHPIASVNIITGITRDETGKPKIEAKKIKDIYVSEKMARRFWDSIDLMFVENNAKDRYAQIVYHEFYFNLPQNTRNKIRYRLNKHIQEFKL
jgi:hypothetical protein